MDLLAVPLHQGDVSSPNDHKEESPPLTRTPSQVGSQAHRIPSHSSPSLPLQGLAPPLPQADPRTMVERFLETGDLTLNPLEHVITLNHPRFFHRVLKKIKGIHGEGTLREILNTPMTAYNHWLPLHYAIKEGLRWIVASLLQEGAEVSVHDAEEGWTPLNLAIFYGNSQLVEHLLSHPCIDVNQPDGNGWTPP